MSFRCAQSIPPIVRLVVMVLLLGCTGCGGTAITRTGEQRRTFGGYPFEAVAKDAEMIAMDDQTLTLIGCLSIPVDLVMDTLALPFDLSAWAYGVQKDPRRDPR